MTDLLIRLIRLEHNADPVRGVRPPRRGPSGGSLIRDTIDAVLGISL
jgi:hypothetical protein